MKVAYIGGGALRILPDIRLLLEKNTIRDGDQIALYDISKQRAELMGKLIEQCPECQGKNINIQIGDSVEQCLDGADFVYFVIRPWRLDVADKAYLACMDAGLLGTDNLSLSGSVFAGIGIPIVVDLAKKMETLCPNAWLMIFSNPIGLLTDAVRKTTKIKAVGVCAGYANHFFDLPKIMNWPAPDYNFDVEVAGLNHFSWILTCKHKGQDYYPQLNEHIKNGIDFHWLEEVSAPEYLIYFLSKMVEAYKRYGAMLYSSEPDGLPRIGFYDEFVERHHRYVLKSIADLEQHQKDIQNHKSESPWSHLVFLVKNGVADELWKSTDGPLSSSYTRRSIGPLLIGGLSGRERFEHSLVVSLPNRGAIKEFPDNAVMEYSVKVENGDLVKANTFSLPLGLVGLTRSLVEHQTLVVDGILAGDFNLFERGMYAYPLMRSFQKGDALIQKLLEIARSQLPKFLNGRT